MRVLEPPAYDTLVVRHRTPVTKEQREAVLHSVDYNIFAFPAGLLTCDFLSDSGTTAMTDTQWAAMLRGDESYGRNTGYYCILEAFRDIFERGDDRKSVYRQAITGDTSVEFFTGNLLDVEGGFANGGPSQLVRPNFFLVPQGRCAEVLLFTALSETLQGLPGSHTMDRSYAVISNGFFDTTAANAGATGFELHNLPQPGLTDAFAFELLGQSNPFKGNLDLQATAKVLEQKVGRVALIILTITNNWAAAQPVSMHNIRGAALLAREHNVPLFFDACRFAENAKFIQDYEDEYKQRSIPAIVQEMFSYADGFTISLKKDGLANMGGALCLRDRGIFTSNYPGIGIRMKERQILWFGNDSYGGMSGRDIMAVTVGLYEVTKEAYLANRIGQVQHFARRLVEEGIPVVLPPGGHAVYLLMDQFFADGVGGFARPWSDFASLGFTLELLRRYGMRAFESGPFAWEVDHMSDDDRRTRHCPDLVRFAVPRNVMCNSHIEYTVAAVAAMHADRHEIPSVRISRGTELRMRHFQCGLELVPTRGSSSSCEHIIPLISPNELEVETTEPVVGGQGTAPTGPDENITSVPATTVFEADPSAGPETRQPPDTASS